MAAHLQQENDDPPDQISNRNIWSSNSSIETMNTKSQKKAINSILRLRLETCFKARFFSSFLFCFLFLFWGGGEGEGFCRNEMLYQVTWPVYTSRKHKGVFHK